MFCVYTTSARYIYLTPPSGEPVDKTKLYEAAHSFIKITENNLCHTLQEQGVRFIDPDRVYTLRTYGKRPNNISIGGGTLLFPDVYLLGDITIGTACTIFPGVHLWGHVSMGDNCVIHPYITLEDVRLGDNVEWGRPNARESEIGDGSRIGRAAEIVRSRIGANVRALHHCYLGDALIGNNVNIGAGTITANFDGKKKNKTVIGDGAFTGVNASVVAPRNIGRGAYIGAGAVITKDVPPNTTVVGLNRRIRGPNLGPK